MGQGDARVWRSKQFMKSQKFLGCGSVHSYVHLCGLKDIEEVVSCEKWQE